MVLIRIVFLLLLLVACSNTHDNKKKRHKNSHYYPSQIEEFLADKSHIRVLRTGSSANANTIVISGDSIYFYYYYERNHYLLNPK